MKRLVLPILLATGLPAADSRIAPGMNAFTIAAYRQLARGDGNLILSPFNIGTALSMALAGAGGRRPRKFIGPAPAVRLHVRCRPGSAARRACPSGKRRGQRIADRERALGAKGIPYGRRSRIPSPTTITTSGAADFAGNSEGARSQINRWTEEQTKERIKDLFPAGSLNSQTRLVLTSAIYFYGNGRTRSFPRARNRRRSPCLAVARRRPTS